MSQINILLGTLQKQLKAPKGQYNSFGKYKFRSCEDIVEAVKKHLASEETLVMSDDVVEVGGRVYVKATVTLRNPEGQITTTAFAREPENKKGMDESQITGTASSYARKYALNGLFAIDDTKDVDTNEHREEVMAKNLEADTDGDLGEYVMPIGYKGIKGEKLKHIDNAELVKTLTYWKAKARSEVQNEVVAVLKNYLNIQ